MLKGKKATNLPFIAPIPDMVSHYSPSLSIPPNPLTPCPIIFASEHLFWFISLPPHFHDEKTCPSCALLPHDRGKPATPDYFHSLLSFCDHFFNLISAIYPPKAVEVTFSTCLIFCYPS